jgi:hypothetical protein
MRSAPAVRARAVRSAGALALLAASLCGCSAAGRSPDSAAISPSYDTTTGKLKELAYDSNHNGVMDTWTDMDGARPVQTRVDRDEDGKVERWEYYDAQGSLIKIGMSRREDGRPNVWVFAAPDGAVERIDISSTADEKRIDRWEHYHAGTIASAEEDTNHDGAVDKWEVYDDGVVRAVAFDENLDGRPDRRLNYSGGTLLSIESEPDAAGRFTKKFDVGMLPSAPGSRAPE